MVYMVTLLTWVTWSLLSNDLQVHIGDTILVAIGGQWWNRCHVWRSYCRLSVTPDSLKIVFIFWLLQMNELVERFGDRLVILAFPCNQFGHQENGDGEEIRLNLRHVRPGNGFQTKALLMEKVMVNGADAHPVFKWLRDKLPAPRSVFCLVWFFFLNEWKFRGYSHWVDNILCVNASSYGPCQSINQSI